MNTDINSSTDRNEATLTLDDLSVKHKNDHQKGHERGWLEVKMTGKLPERRSYQISWVYNDTLYIFGGQDLKEGAYNTLWRLPMKVIMEGGTTSWEQVSQSGSVPPPISHHNGVLYKDSLYVFGGLVGSDSNHKIYQLSMRSFKWSIVESKNGPKGRDDHSGCGGENGKLMYIFGGYVDGGKANDLWQYDIENDEWVVLDKGDYDIVDTKHYNPNLRPCPRIGATIEFYKGHLYLFGGHDQSNEKLDDFWKFDLSTGKWEQIQLQGFIPSGRNGHTTVIINNKMVMFGGILEVTKESDEVFVYDFDKNNWVSLDLNNNNTFDRMNSPRHRETDSVMGDNQSVQGRKDFQQSGTLRKNKQTSSMPNLNNNNNQLDLTLSKKQSLINANNTNTRDSNGGGSLTRKATVSNVNDQQFIKYMRGQQTLSSPTSVSMKNAFILKNANPSFESYYLSMKKRRNIKLGASINLSISIDAGRSIHIQKNKPSARDGHSAFVYLNKMFIFGGDRHHMPFNDIFFLDIDL